MGELKPCKKAIEITNKILQLFEDEGLTFAEVADVPAELTRRINRNTSRLQNETLFKLPR